MFNNKSSGGFTLVELSIVLVIIGLIISATMAGKSLVATAKLRVIMSETKKFKEAYYSFQLKYDELPGDMSYAHDVWGSDCDASATKCNGNGNGSIGYFIWDSGSTNNNDDSELTRAWQHFYLAGMITRELLGDAVTYPTEKIDYFSDYAKDIRYKIETTNPTDTIFNKNVDDTYVVLGNGDGVLAFWHKGISLSATMSIDRKIDDGVANEGKMFSLSGKAFANDACSEDKAVANGADYNTANLDDESGLCVPVFFF